MVFIAVMLLLIAVKPLLIVLSLLLITLTLLLTISTLLLTVIGVVEISLVVLSRCRVALTGVVREQSERLKLRSRGKNPQPYIPFRDSAQTTFGLGQAICPWNGLWQC